MVTNNNCDNYDDIKKNLLKILNNPSNNLKQKDIAIFLNINPSTISRWITCNDRGPSKNITRKVKEWIISYNNKNKILNETKRQIIPQTKDNVVKNKSPEEEINNICDNLSDLQIKNIPREGYIYLILCESSSHIKIGRSISPVKRYNALKTGNIHSILIMYHYSKNYVKSEFEIHKELKQYRLNHKDGTLSEWFDCSIANAVSVISKNCLF